MTNANVSSERLRDIDATRSQILRLKPRLFAMGPTQFHAALQLIYARGALKENDDLECLLYLKSALSELSKVEVARTHVAAKVHLVSRLKGLVVSAEKALNEPFGTKEEGLTTEPSGTAASYYREPPLATLAVTELPDGQTEYQGRLTHGAEIASLKLRVFEMGAQIADLEKKVETLMRVGNFS